VSTPPHPVLAELAPIIPRDALEVTLVLALAFFIGLEREEHKQQGPAYAFGGVRTFPLIALLSYALARIVPEELGAWVVGFAVIGGFMLLAYRHKLSGTRPAGLTTETSALVTYVVGGLVAAGHYWIAATLGVVAVLLLELKKGLEGLTHHVAPNEIVTVAKFLILSVVILPIVPNRDFTRFELNPFRVWVVVVAVSAISFASYVLQRLLKDRAGVFLSAVLGGLYSSTATTVALSRQAKAENRPDLYAGAIVTASGVMYFRLILLLAVFSRTLAVALAPAFAGLALVGCVAGWRRARRDRERPPSRARAQAVKNPLELRSAALFAFLFVCFTTLTRAAHEGLGRCGLYALAAMLGVADVDPFILGVAQNPPASVHVAASAILIAAASNNVAKAIYAFAFADRTTGRKSMARLLALGVAGLVPLAWV
jgi:uncharacterized membrane protein (DUF4010 family)